MDVDKIISKLKRSLVHHKWKIITSTFVKLTRSFRTAFKTYFSEK